MRTVTGKRKNVVIYTDGGASPNPGAGGWGAVLQCNGVTKELSGAEAETTNNRMELTAAIEALSALKQPCKVELHTDSEYLKKGVSEWMAKWKRNGWKTRGGGAVKNRDLWMKLDELSNRHDITWCWVPAHTGIEYNERCDALCHEARRALRAGGGSGRKKHKH